MSARALWYVAPRQAEIRAAAADGPVIVRASHSLISRGTERLVFAGRAPEAEFERMRAPMQEGAFPFPVKYGYAAVGLVEAGPAALIGRDVFALHPHQTRFSPPEAALALLPADLPLRRAALAANMETALNAIWDSGAGPGDRVAVIGAGLVGCLVAALLSPMPGVEVSLIDKLGQREAVAAHLNVIFARPDAAPRDCDLAFHASASAEGLATAMGCLGDEGRLVEMSWYGEGTTPAPLGGAFHARRLALISSQVGRVAPSRRPRWSHARRLAKAIELLADPRLDALIDGEVAFDDLPERLPEILAPGAPGIATVVTYD